MEEVLNTIHEGAVHQAGLDTPKRANRKLLRRMREHEGYAQLSAIEREDFDKLLLSNACDPVARAAIKGGVAGVRYALDCKARTAFRRLRAWREAGLIHENTGSGLLRDERTGRVYSTAGEYQLRLPGESLIAGGTLVDTPGVSTGVTTVVSAADGSLREVLACGTSLLENAKDGVRGVTSSPCSREQASKAEAVIRLLEARHGVHITGHGRDLFFEALIEDESGTRACYEEAKTRGRNPIALLLTMLKAGEHRGRLYMAACEHCYERKPDVRDRKRELGVAIALCDHCRSFCHSTQTLAA